VVEPHLVAPLLFHYALAAFDYLLLSLPSFTLFPYTTLFRSGFSFNASYSYFTDYLITRIIQLYHPFFILKYMRCKYPSHFSKFIPISPIVAKPYEYILF